MSDAEPQPEEQLLVSDLLDLQDLEDYGVRAAVTGGVRIPGCTWKPFTNREVSSTALIGPRAIIEHTMGVGTMLGSWNYHNAVGKPYTHLYRDGIGNALQAQGADRRAAGTLEGNPYVIACENEDYGRWFPDGGTTCGSIPPFRAEQLRKIAVDDAWLCTRFGIPAVLMADSCASTRGIGYHRLGIYPWRKSGCLSYSNSNYKCCPDLLRIAQMPGIVRAIAAIIGGSPQEEDMPWFKRVTLAGSQGVRVVSSEGAVAGFPNATELGEYEAALKRSGYSQLPALEFTERDDWERYFTHLAKPVPLTVDQTAMAAAKGVNAAAEAGTDHTLAKRFDELTST